MDDGVAAGGVSPLVADGRAGLGDGRFAVPYCSHDRYLHWLLALPWHSIPLVVGLVPLIGGRNSGVVYCEQVQYVGGVRKIAAVRRRVYVSLGRIFVNVFDAVSVE